MRVKKFKSWAINLNTRGGMASLDDISLELRYQSTWRAANPHYS